MLLFLSDSTFSTDIYILILMRWLNVKILYDILSLAVLVRDYVFLISTLSISETKL